MDFHDRHLTGLYLTERKARPMPLISFSPSHLCKTNARESSLQALKPKKKERKERNVHKIGCSVCMFGNNSLSHSSKAWIALLGRSWSALSRLRRQQKGPTSKTCGDGRSSAQSCKAACIGFPSRETSKAGSTHRREDYWGQSVYPSQK